MLSLGIDCALAALTAARRRGFMSGSGMPILAATVISRLSLENCAERFLSCAPLRCIMFLNLEWPAIGTPKSRIVGQLPAGAPAWRGPYTVPALRGNRRSVMPAPALA